MFWDSGLRLASAAVLASTRNENRASGLRNVGSAIRPWR